MVMRSWIPMIEVTPRTYHQLQTLAQRFGCTVDDIIGRMLDAEIESQRARSRRS